MVAYLGFGVEEILMMIGWCRGVVVDIFVVLLGFGCGESRYCGLLEVARRRLLMWCANAAIKETEDKGEGCVECRSAASS